MSPKKKYHPPAALARILAPWRTIRRLNHHQWLYLPRLFSKQERNWIFALIGVALVSFGVLSSRIINRITVERPAVGGVLREGTIGEPRFINPLYASSDTDRDLTSIVFAGLTRYDESGAVAMDLAQSVAVSPDGKTYTAELRPGLRWQDGEPLSSGDITFTIKTIQDPAYQSPLRPNWQGVAVEKLGDTTVRFSLRQPYAPFMGNLALGILPEHLWRKIPREAAILSDLNLKPVGSGPYQFKKLTRTADGSITSLALTRNAHYHGDGPYLKEIRFSFYPDEAALVAAYRRNEIDGLALSSASWLEELKKLDLELHELKLPKLFAVFLNPAVDPPLGRKAVRTALAMAIDRSVVVGDTVAGGGVPVNSAIPPGTFGFNPDIPGLPFDPERAKNILTTDGWKDSNRDGRLDRTEGSGRNRKTTTLQFHIVTSDTPELASAANAIAHRWNAIGVKADVKALPIVELEATMIRPRAYGVLLFGEVFSHDPDPFAFWHTSQLKDPGLNIALYSNRTVDQLLEEARRTTDPTVRAEKYRQFQKIVSDDVGAIFLYQPANYYAIRKGFRGINLKAVTLPEERFNDIQEWYQDTRRALK